VNRGSPFCALAKAGVLIEEREDGWLIKQEWWRKRQREGLNQEAGLLTI